MMVLFVLAASTLPQRSQGQGWNVEVVGQTGGECLAVSAAGNYAYMAEGVGLRILNISRPSSPVPVGHVMLPDRIEGIFLSGSKAYVANGTSGLRIVDVINPAAPTIVGTFSDPHWVACVYASGNYAYVGAGSNLRILDVSIPTSPSLRGSYNVSDQINGVFVSGGLAYVVSNYAGLHILNVSNPRAPSYLGNYNTPGTAKSVWVSGSRAYIADEGALRIVSVSTPTSPTTLGSCSGGQDVCVSGNLAYVAADIYGLRIYNVSNPAVPSLVSVFDTRARALKVHLSGTLAFVAQDQFGIEIVDVSTPASPRLLGSFDPPDGANGVFVSGGKAYVSRASLMIFDCTYPSSPSLRSDYDMPGYARNTYVSGHIAYVADGYEGLAVVDVSIPTSPTLRCTYKTPAYAEDVFVSGNYAYVAAHSSGLRIFNVSNPSSPTLAGVYDTPNYAFGVYVSGRYAYVADGDSGLQIIDVINPHSPVLRGTYNTPGLAQGVFVYGNFAYVADGTRGLQILDVTDPTSPILRGTYDALFTEALDVSVVGNLAYIASGWGGLEIVDVGNPAAPRLRGWYEVPVDGTFMGIHVSGGLAYVAAADLGLWVLRFAPPPPPAAPFDLTATAASSSRINLAWKDNATNEDGFLIERRIGSVGGWTQIGTVTKNTKSYSDYGLWAGTLYGYRVKAFNGGGESAYSNEVWVRTTGTPAALLAGRVFNQETGQLLVGATVGIGSNQTTSDAQGEYLLHGLSDGTVTAVVTKTGFYPLRRQVTLAGGTTVVENFGLQPLEPGAGPVIYSVTSKYCWPGKTVYFLDGVSLNVEFTVALEWNGTPGVVRFITPKGTFEQSGLKRTFNMGSDFGPRGTMTVVARNGAGQESAPYPVEFVVLPAPPGIGLTGATFKETERDFKYSIKMGVSLIEVGVGDGTIKASIPLVGGKAFKIIKSMQLAIEFSSQGTASADFEMEIPTTGEGIKLGAAEVTPKVKIHVEWTYNRDHNDWDTTGYFELSAEAALKLPPTPPYCVYLLTLGPVPIYLRGEVSVGLTARLEINGWSSSGPSLNGVLTFSPGLKGFLGAGVAEVVALEGYLGGTLNLEGQWPQTPMLRKCSLLFTGGIRVVILIYEYSTDLLTYEWDLYSASGFPETFLAVPEIQTIGPDQFRVMPRDYLNATPYAQFVANEAPFEAVGGGTMRTQAAIEQRLEQNVFPFSQPAVATALANTLLTWVHDDPARTSVNRTELVFSRYNGSVWTPPAPVADNGTADFAPALAALPDGTFLAAWDDVKQVLPSTATLTAMASKMEIGASRYHPATGTWDAALRLTNNNALDHTPRIASAPDGTALLTWIYNAANDSIGSATATNTIYSRKWTGTSWDAIRTVRSGLGAITKTSLAYKNGEGVLVFSSDADGNLATEGDQELYAIPWNGSSWGPLTRLTNNTVRDASPQAIYDSQGNLIVCWLQADRIVTARGLTLQNQRTAVVCGRTAGAGDFRLALDPATSGPLVLFWADTSSKGQDLWTATYDGLRNSWGSATQITNDDSMERSPAATFRSAGQWILAYNKVQTVYTTRTVVVDGHPVKVPNIPGAGRTDLYVIKHTVGGDLAIRSSDISITPSNPAPTSGTVLRATVWNLGDLAAKDVEVGFYDGDPATGGQRIGALQIIPGVFAAGTSATVVTKWTVPAGASPRRVFVVVDPSNRQSDRDRSNNKASIAVMKPDLAVREFYSDKMGSNHYALTVRIVNQGTVASSPTVVRIYLETGPRLPLYEVSIPRLDAGAWCDFGFVWNVGRNRGTVSLRAIVDVTNLVAEDNESNNEAIICIFGLNPASSRNWALYR
jgi:hypothetical protein